MKLNNKGFATTAIMYSILTLILMLLLGSMAYLANRKKVLDKIKQDTYNEVNEIIYGNLEPEDFEYTGNYQVYKVMKSGYYKVELWGASGYSSQGGYGKGGYTSGYIHLTSGEKLYIYVGDNSNCSTGYTFNGGGCGEAVGGGATDVRYFGNTTPTAAQLAWDSELGLNSRIMVAAGGGGGVYSNVTSTAVGHAGGLLGLTPANNFSTNLGKGGTQTSGGATGSAGNYTYESNMDGSFGKGGYMASRASGGGSGYYGGGHGRHPGGSWPGGGGGSSFISGYAGVNAITSATNRTHTNNTKHYSGKFFIGGIMKAGNEEMPTYDGLASIIGNPNKGHAKISYVGATVERKDDRLNNVRYIKSCTNGNTSNVGNHWVEIQAIKDGTNIAKGKTVTGTYSQGNSTTNAYSYIVDGLFDNITGSSGFGSPSNNSNPCITIDLGQTYNLDEIASWNWWIDGRTYKNYTLSVSSNNSNWTTLLSNDGMETSQGKRVSAYVGENSSLYNYTNETQTFHALSTGYYRVELWGAKGGEGKFNTNAGTELGGKGAYTSGIIKLNQDDKLYLYVGGAGTNATSASQHASIAGGYNGGGNGLSGGTDDQAGSAGGATDARVTSGAWDDATSLNSRIMVAAGGGGGHCDTNTAYGNNRIKFPLMNGQGLMYSGTLGQWQGSTYSVSASQTAGNAFGKGGNHTNLGATHGAGGGGGGYWGGRANTANNNGGPGSGGTSFISGFAGVNAIASASSTAASNTTKHYSGKYFVDGVMNVGVNDAAGKAQVTYLGSSLEQPRFTDTYQRLEYIQSTGTQYIDTGIKFNTNVDKFEINFQANDANGNYFIAGSGYGEAGKIWVYNYKGGNRFSLYINDTGGTQREFYGIDGPDAYKHKIVLNAKKLYVDEVLKADNTSYTFANTPTTFTLFNAQNTTNPNGYIAKTRIYSFKMWKYGELVRDMVPVKRRSDNAIGLYDKVEDKFYANAGTGTFTAGPVIDLTNVRYVKDCIKGSSQNNWNHWVELQVIKNGNNLVKGKTATGITATSNEPLSRITDGDISTDYYASSGVQNVNECVTLDLGSTYDLDEIAVWHYWKDARVYNNHTLSVSNNNSTWRNLITSTEKETSQGKRVSSHY